MTKLNEIIIEIHTILTRRLCDEAGKTPSLILLIGRDDYNQIMVDPHIRNYFDIRLTGRTINGVPFYRVGDGFKGFKIVEE